MKKLVLILVYAFPALVAKAQLDPLYAQYYNNPMLINPAFAGSNERFYAAVGYRNQWTGVAGGPITYNFNAHTSIIDNHVGVGFVAVNDQFGDVRNTLFGTTLSYRIKFRKSTLSFGMEGGATRYSNTDGLTIRNNPDPAFMRFNTTMFNIGSGFLLQNERLTISVSVPRMLTDKVSVGANGVQIYSRSYYLYGMYQFLIFDRIRFKPSVLLRAAQNSKVSTDVNLNFVFNQLYTAGVFTRQLNTYGLMLQMIVHNYRFGYVFEVPGKSSALFYTTHELTAAISLDVFSFHDHSRTGY